MELPAWVINNDTSLALCMPLTINSSFRVIRTTGHPVENLTPFLEDLKNGNIQSPYLLSTEIQVYESVAEKQKRPVDEKALEVIVYY
jgi:uncharacterized protein Yka (UPF0111/DUF47 family)